MTQAQPPVAIFEIKEYMVIWRQLEQRDFGGIQALVRAMVRCSGLDPKTNQQYMMDVFFLAPDSPFPPPQIDLENKRGAIFMPISDIMAFVDILRNESPIFGHLRGDKPEWTSVTTTNEPVGEGDAS